MTTENRTTSNHRETTARPRRALTVDGKTVCDAYVRRVEMSANDRVYLVKHGGTWHPLTWAEVHKKVLGIFASLKKMGIQRGDKVCIMANTRPEWFMCDMAAMALGACSVPIYHSSTNEDVGFILEHCEAKLVFAEDEIQTKKLKEIGCKVPVVVMDDSGCATLDCRKFSEFSAGGETKENSDELKRSAAQAKPDDMASIVYTSGTTGRPKGAVLMHNNFATELRGVIQEIELRSDDVLMTFLPFAHILGRVESFLPVFAGVTSAFAENINVVAANIAEVKPTILVAVPRIYEKIYTRIQSEVESAPAIRRNIFKWAVGIGREVARLRSEKASIPIPTQIKFAIADKVVFSKVRGKLGGNVRLSISGGAPLSRELCEFLHACGIKVLEGYGLTETTAAVTCNRPEDYKFGSVGRPVPPTDIKIAPDGEILIKGPLVFKEYYKNPEATKEVLTSDGWFSSGDIGEIDARGFLRITDRKKELIVTSGGKNIAPQKIENLIKQSRFMSNGMVYGDQQKYLVALITLNELEVTKWAKEQGIAFTSVADLAGHPKVQSVIENEMKSVNGSLASYETVKKFKILPADFTIESGEITPSLKLKRKVVTQRYKGEIDAMYA